MARIYYYDGMANYYVGGGIRETRQLLREALAVPPEDEQLSACIVADLQKFNTESKIPISLPAPPTGSWDPLAVVKRGVDQTTGLPYPLLALIHTVETHWILVRFIPKVCELPEVYDTFGSAPPNVDIFNAALLQHLRPTSSELNVRYIGTQTPCKRDEGCLWMYALYQEFHLKPLTTFDELK
jgi:hypothetical protein